MASYDLLLLPGDGIGPEVMAATQTIIDWFERRGVATFKCDEDLAGGAAFDAYSTPVAEHTRARAEAAAVVLVGAAGGAKWDVVPFELRPEAALLHLRKELDLFANLRPVFCHRALAGASPLRAELLEGVDIIIVRELAGGVYYGEPKAITDLGEGQRRAVDTQVYETREVDRIARVAFDLAQGRRRKVTSMEKRNVMVSGLLWHDVVSAVQGAYPEVTLEHMLSDAGAMQLVRSPRQFDVIVTDNLFGDMISDIGGALTGSLGMLPSASLGAPDPATGRRRALYEPVHGSAPDIAGRGIANPLAMIASFAMALRYSFNLPESADLLDAAVSSVLDQGLRTADIMTDGARQVGTAEMTTAVVAELDRMSG